MIGSSTGGPGHIEKILKHLPPEISYKIIIAQHMEHSLVASFTHRLNSISPLHVTATEGDSTGLEDADIFICSQTCELQLQGKKLYLQTIPLDAPSYNPLIDRLFISAAGVVPHVQIAALLLTGIGEDGARGLLALREAGAETVAESEKSAIVYGMPRAAREMNAAARILDLDEIIGMILEFGGSDV